MGADAIYTSQAFVNADNNPLEVSDARFLLNATVGFEMENFGIFAYGRKLLAQRYATGSIISVATNEIERFRNGEPRTFGLDVTVSF